MSVDAGKLRNALSLFQKDDAGWFWSAKYVNFSSHVDHGWHFTEDADSKKRLRKVHGFLALTTSDLWYLLTICYHANWQKDMALEGKLGHEWYGDFLVVDIDAFHTKYRAIFDTIASVIKWMSVHPSNLPGSFTDLQKRVQKPGNSGALASDLAGLVSSCDWYSDMKETRELFIHYNASTMVFPAPKILFQVHKGYDNVITKRPEIMYNPYVVDFELYAGLHIGYLLWYLEEMAEVGYKVLPSLTRYETRPKSYHPGFGTIKEWIERLLAVTENSDPKVA